MFKITVKINEIALRKRAEKTFYSIVNEAELLNDIGRTVKTRIVGEARRGTPLNSANSFPSLAPSTIANREQIALQNRTGRTYSPERSNLTLTGKFLDSFGYTIKVNRGKAPSVNFAFEGDHPGYVTEIRETATKRGKPSKKTKTIRTKSVKNSDLFGWLKEKGFAVFDRSVQDNENLIRRLQSVVRRYLRKTLRNKIN